MVGFSVGETVFLLILFAALQHNKVIKELTF